MEIWGTVLVALGVVTAGAAAAFAWVQAHAALETLKDARDARDEARASEAETARLAAEANAAFKRQAEAQEEANRLKIKEMTPPDWRRADTGSGDMQRVTNTSGGTLIVHEFDVRPEEAESRFSLHSSAADGVYEYGDSFQFSVWTGFGANVEKLTVVYSRHGETDRRRFIIPL